MSAPITRTERTRARRVHERARYDRDVVNGIIDAGLMCHVGYVIDGQPYVTPTCHWRKGDHIYWHGSSASRAIRAQKGDGVPVSLTVSHLDGIVMTRSGFHHSVNYRSVMIFGTAHVVEGFDAKNASLKAFMDRITPGRWEELRPVTEQEMKGTTILGMAIDEVSAKVRDGGGVEEDGDYDWPAWAGVVPVHTTLGEPIDGERLVPGTVRPAYLDGIKLG